MQLVLSRHPFHFECENLCRVFFPYSPVKKTDTPETTDPLVCRAVIDELQGAYEYQVSLSSGEKKQEKTAVSPEKEEYTLTRLLFDLFCEFTGYRPPWGMLTGIHPVKLLHQYTQQEGEEAAAKIFTERFAVSPEKLRLAQETLRVQEPVIRAIGENDFSLYIGIPFCPTRCSYCSFVAELCETVYRCFDTRNCTEFTVEAGRPDTITEEKLLTLKNAGVGRISINPQSLSDQVLRAIGRNHTAEDIYRAFEAASRVGISSINSDLIAGLPEDTLETFRHTLDTVLSLGAGNVTVHCLALKRAASLDDHNRHDISLHAQGDLVASMVEESVVRLHEAGFQPYYLYRQSRMAGNLENTGWAKDGDLCAYNIYTMDESVTVLACGAGAVSKVKDPYSNRLERIFNFKYPFEYITRNDEILKRKDGVTGLYEQFRKRIH